MQVVARAEVKGEGTTSADEVASCLAAVAGGDPAALVRDHSAAAEASTSANHRCGLSGETVQENPVDPCAKACTSHDAKASHCHVVRSATDG